MTQNENLRKQGTSTLIKPMLIGAGIAFFVIAYFLIGAGKGNPAWPAYWQVKPLLMVPVAGAMGGAFYHLLGNLRAMGGWKAVLGTVIGILGYVFILWIGTVLGLNGTMWD
ncbi:potassium transporter KefB [Pedobacter yulinensis]|uniref:Potassium transporter KefB n=1 Tax=Pedobacter yulinensis TaxID=2126353 RepID=A0A2T3HL67_9SPHI|nr:potassium transporter KefB [Pedobacter yulinensis]PST83153.1 potassium transporter KefB [Pedobacter yulinensis]